MWHPLSMKVGTTSPTSGGRSVGIVHSQAQATEFFIITPVIGICNIIISGILVDVIRVIIFSLTITHLHYFSGIHLAVSHTILTNNMIFVHKITSLSISSLTLSSGNNG
jgi:hypothetical protein